MLNAILLCAAIPCGGVHYDVAPVLLYQGMVVPVPAVATTHGVEAAGQVRAAKPIRRVISAPVRVFRRTQPVRRAVRILPPYRQSRITTCFGST